MYAMLDGFDYESCRLLKLSKLSIRKLVNNSLIDYSLTSEAQIPSGDGRRHLQILVLRPTITMLSLVTAALSFSAPANKAFESRVAGVAAAAAFALASPAFAGDAAAGAGVFSGNCAACHAGGQNVIMPDKTLEKAALEEYLAGGFNEEAVIKQVTNGKNAMPAFGGRLSDDDIANVASYVIKTSSAGWD